MFDPMMCKSPDVPTRRAANTNQPIENRLNFNRPTCYSRLTNITCTTKLINTVEVSFTLITCSTVVLQCYHGRILGGIGAMPLYPQDDESYFMCNNKGKNCMLSQYMQNCNLQHINDVINLSVSKKPVNTQ